MSLIVHGCGVPGVESRPSCTYGPINMHPSTPISTHLHPSTLITHLINYPTTHPITHSINHQPSPIPSTPISTHQHGPINMQLRALAVVWNLWCRVGGTGLYYLCIYQWSEGSAGVPIESLTCISKLPRKCGVCAAA